MEENNKEITYKVIGVAYEVHNNLGPGFQEVIYQRALAREFMAKNINFAREEWIPVYYKNTVIGKRRVDFTLSKIIVEIKARAEIKPKDYIQTLSYLKATKFKIALLLNFGTKQLQVKRFIN
ncbi:MAG: GxxExxY protein [Patescibacteria group bacterium]|jgi:GxxExxY protein